MQDQSRVQLTTKLTLLSPEPCGAPLPHACPAEAKALASSALPGLGRVSSDQDPAPLSDFPGQSACSPEALVTQPWRLQPRGERRKKASTASTPRKGREGGTRSADPHSQSPAPATGRQKAPSEPLSHPPHPRRGPHPLAETRPGPGVPSPTRLGSAHCSSVTAIASRPAGTALAVPAGKRKPPEPLLPPVLPHPTLTSPMSRPPHHPQRWEKGSQRAAV